MIMEETGAEPLAEATKCTGEPTIDPLDGEEILMPAKHDVATISRAAIKNLFRNSALRTEAPALPIERELLGVFACWERYGCINLATMSGNA